MEDEAGTTAGSIHIDLLSFRVARRPVWSGRTSEDEDEDAGRSRESANWNRRGIIALFVMRRWRLGSQPASSFDHGRLCRHPHPPSPFSHTAVYVPECFRTHNARVAGQDGVLFNDAKRRRLSLLAYFRSFTMSRSTTPSFYVQTHIPAHTRARLRKLPPPTCGLAVIKNETTGFLKAPRTEGKRQQRSGEKSPPGNNE